MVQITGKWGIFITLSLLCLGHAIIDFMIGIWPVYKMMADLDLAKAGFIVAMAAFIGEGSQLLFGTLSDRGYQKQILVGSIIVGSGGVLIAYSEVYFVLFFLYLLTCLGSGAFHPPAAAYVNQMLPARRAVMMGIFATFGNIGLGSSQLIFSNTYKWMDGHTAILLIPGIVLAFILLLFKFPKIEASVAQKPKIKDLFQFFHHKDLKNLYFSQVANQTILWGSIFLLPNVLQTLGHPDWICLGGGHSCLILGSALMMVPAGYLADRFSSRTVLLTANTIGSILFYFLLFYQGLPQWLYLVGLACLGASLGLVNPVAVSLGNKLMPTKPAMISAFLMGLVWCVSEALGPGGMGLLSTQFEDGGPVKAMAILGSFFLISLYTTYKLPQENPGIRVGIQ